MRYDAGGTEICVHVHKNNVSDGSLSSLIYRAETKNAGTPDWSRSKLQKEREEHMRRINPREVLSQVWWQLNYCTSSRRLICRTVATKILSIWLPCNSWTKLHQQRTKIKSLFFSFFEKKSKSFKNQIVFSNRTFF